MGTIIMGSTDVHPIDEALTPPLPPPNCHLSLVLFIILFILLFSFVCINIGLYVLRLTEVLNAVVVFFEVPSQGFVIIAVPCTIIISYLAFINGVKGRMAQKQEKESI